MGWTHSTNLQMFVPPDAVPGSYRLHLMVYYSDDLEPIPTAVGRRIIQVATVQVGGESGQKFGHDWGIGSAASARAAGHGVWATREC